MKVVISSAKLEEPPYEITDAHTVVIKDDCGNPICVAIHQTQDNNIWMMTPDDPRFIEIVKEMGITKRLAVTIGG